MDMNTKYNWFNSLLLYFLEDGYYEERNDIDTIKRYVDTFDSNTIRKTLEQGKEVLTLNPFPAEWIQNTTNRYPFDQGHETKLEDYYQWVEWMVKTLEEEAKKAGKDGPETEEEKKAREDKKTKQLEEAKEISDFWDKYPAFAKLIYGFFTESLLLDIAGKTDAPTRKSRMLQVISDYAKETDESEIQRSVEESKTMFETVNKEVIKKMIKDRSNNYLNRIGATDQSSEGYYYWLGLIHNTLEEEAKKAGKI